jgi:hypothetical protein
MARSTAGPSSTTNSVGRFANSGGALQQLLKVIASGPDSPYYYYAPNGDTLQQVFREITNHLSELRWAK